MSKRAGYTRRLRGRGAAHVLSILAMSFGLLTLLLGGGGGNVIRQVGGVMVDAEGVVAMAPVDERTRFADEVRSEAGTADESIDARTEMRMVSLKNLNAEIAKAVAEHRDELPAAVRYMAGIQRVEHVFLYPEDNDIVLAGPGEGWVVDGAGNVVGESTGQPVVQLSDLLTALQTAGEAAEGEGISCSIDPTPEGTQRLQKFLKSARKSGFNGNTIEAAQNALGPQRVSVTGVPLDSRFAQIMVAADYQMKRIAMHLDETPVAGVPSYLTMLKQRKAKPASLQPRWWLACNYEPLSRSEDGLAWHLNGQGVKSMTEDDFVNNDGSRKATGKSNPIAQEWSDNMTENYAELSKAMPVFGELRNLMDLSVVAALIEKEQMLEKVDLELPMLMTRQSATFFAGYNTPTSVKTVCSFMPVRKGTLLTASGGVLVDSWSVVANAKVANDLNKNYEAANPHQTAAWFWN